jgi:hypothetical protein
MPLPTPEEFLAKLTASPTDAAAFDAATRRERPHCKTRREAVAATLSAVKATLAESAAMKAQLATKRQKIAALESARATAGRLKTSPQTPMTTPSATSIASEILRLQAEAEAAAKIKTRAQFNELTPQAKSDFFRKGGKLA